MKFHSEILQDAFLEAQPSLVNFQTNLNNLSDDISNLEKFLKEKNICFNFEHLCFESFDPDYKTDHYLVWEEYTSPNNTQNSSFRILYCTRIYDPSGQSIDPETTNSKPLIETKVKIRLKLFEYLSKFLNELAKKCETSHLFKEDLPF